MIGIGGTGMRSLAQVLLDLSWQVAGSDARAASCDFERLAGVRYYAGHRPEHLDPSTSLVIHSSAVAADSPEFLLAAKLKIPTMSYPQALGRLMQGRYGLAVAGTHGKSTITAMAAEILAVAGHDPTVVYGAQPSDRKAHSGSRGGDGRAVLVEACEFQQNFLCLRPQDALISNVEWDHVDCYDSPESVEEAFARFVSLLPTDGRIIIPKNDKAARRVARHADCRVEEFGVESGAEWDAKSLRPVLGKYAFELYFSGYLLGSVSLRVPGRHNVENALGAAAIAYGQGLSGEEICRGLSRFAGLQRRLQTVSTHGGITWIDDYAHHPTEITASLAAIRAMHPGRRVRCVFQPHQAARTEFFLSNLGRSLQNADQILIADIFRARESPYRVGDVTAADLAQAVRLYGIEVPAIHCGNKIASFLQTQLTAGDVLVTMGAGDIGRIGYGVMERVGSGCAAR